MTDFATHAVLGGPIASMVAKDKGDISNRAQCAKDQLVNNVKTLAADTVVLSGAAGATAVAGKNQDKLAQVFDKFTSKLKDINANITRNIEAKMPKPEKGKLYKRPLTKQERIGRKIVEVFEKFKTPTAKAAALVATFVVLPAMGLISYINHRHSYREGQIDQKYTDKAKLENQGKKLI